MKDAQAIAFVREHGVVLVSANGPVPKVTESIAKESIRGSWWSHRRSHEIFKVLERLRESPEVLVCRLVEGKLTLVHRRLWPALVRVARHFPKRQVAQIQERHTPSGHHVACDVGFPNWVPPEVAAQARTLDEAEAFRALGEWAIQKQGVDRLTASKTDPSGAGSFKNRKSRRVPRRIRSG